LVAKHRLGTNDLIAFILTSVVLNSADKVRRTVAASMDKLKGFRDGIVKHSGGGGGTAAGIGVGAGGTTVASSAAQMQDTSAADRVTWIGVWINLLLSVGKLVIGVTQHSSALIADAGHSLSDLVSDFITLWSVQIARLPPDDDHPYGHYKFEAIGSLFLSLTLLATGVGVGAMANKQLLQLLAAGKQSSTGAAAAAMILPGPLALVMAGISIASKEWLFRITKVVGERLNSPVVLANAWHHRSDAYSSVLALLSIAWAMAGFKAADAAAGLLVAGMICMTGGDILVESIQQLSDSSNQELQHELQHVVQDYIQQDDDVLCSTSIRARQVGSSAFVDVIVETVRYYCSVEYGTI
jgi:cation diffusion facilitator family transporter